MFNCQYKNVCGGCPLGELKRSEYKKILKSRFLSSYESFDVDFPGDDFVDFVEFVEGKESGYRARISLTDGGFVSPHGKKPFLINRCPVASDEINFWLSSNAPDSRPRGRVNVFGCAISDPPVAACEGDVVVRFKGEAPIKFPVAGFFQSNIELLEKLKDELKARLRGESLLDLYGGVGTFSAFLSKNFLFTTVVETSATAITYASENLTSLIKSKLYAQRSSDWVSMDGRRLKFDCVVADPPRGGLDKKTLNYLTEKKIPLIAYISCNYATQARDVAVLVKAGYKIDRAAIYDFYHGTADIESLVILVL